MEALQAHSHLERSGRRERRLIAPEKVFAEMGDGLFHGGIPRIPKTR